MSKIKHIGNNVVRYMYLWICAAVLASCSFGEEYADSDPEVVALQLNITAREEGDLNTRASGEMEEGTDHEYIHNLCVLLVQDNKVVKKILPDLSDNEAARVGNLKTWVSDAFTLATGQYTVYAFANIDSYYGTGWSSLTGIGEGEDISGLGIDNLVLEDPAGKVDLEQYFIPMSARIDISVTSATKSISIGLDRLISKIRMTATADQANVKVKAFSFGGYADRVSLFADAVLSDVNYDLVRQFTYTDQSPVFDQSGKVTLPDFYVNASPAGHPFQVSITTDEKGGVTYQATTQRDELPRNSIYPLNLQLNVYGLDLAAKCWVSPIGSLPVQVQVAFEPDAYVINVPEGCQFELTVNGISGSSSITDLICTWNMPDGVTGIDFEGESAGVQTVKGHVTATQGKTFDLSLLVTWKDGAASYNRTYTVTLITGDLTDFPLLRTTETSPFVLDYLNPEMLNMFIKK